MKKLKTGCDPLIWVITGNSPVRSLLKGSEISDSNMEDSKIIYICSRKKCTDMTLGWTFVRAGPFSELIVLLKYTNSQVKSSHGNVEPVSTKLSDYWITEQKVLKSYKSDLTLNSYDWWNLFALNLGPQIGKNFSFHAIWWSCWVVLQIRGKF